MFKNTAYLELEKETQIKIHNDCVSFLKKNLEFSIPANLICSLFVFFILYTTTNLLGLFTWFAAVVLVSILRGFIYFRSSVSSPALTLKLLVIGTIVSGVLWGIVGSLLMPSDNLLDQMLVTIIVISVATGEIDALKSNTKLSLIFLVMTLLPLNLWFFYQNSINYFLLGLSFFTYFCFMLLVFLRGYTLFINSLILRYHNLSLIEKLSINNEILEESESRFRSAFDFAAIGMALVSLEGCWLKVNQSLCHIVGYSEDELLKIDFQTITYPDDLESDLSYVKQLLAGELITYQLEKRYIHKNGTILWILLSVSLLRDKQLNPLYFISQIQNIDSQKKAEQELKDLAYHDSLTGLSNRKQLEAFFTFALPNAKRHRALIAILFIDLDSFKEINDKFGHNIGDLLLIEIGSRLKSSVRINDMPARLGGDEFIVVLTEVSNVEQVLEVAKKILMTVAKPMILQQHEISITASIGISVYPETGENLSTLLLQADKALYEIKSKGKNNYKLALPKIL